MISAKYFLSSLLLGMTAIPSIVGDETPMIIGGNDADRYEFPYFVKVTGMIDESQYSCGGVLIAPDMVLTAAHCGLIDGANRITNLYVGIYSIDNADSSGQVRTCKTFLPHPGYDENNESLDNDVALCELNEPVVIDQSRFRIELNEDPLFPSPGDLVTSIGLGHTNLHGKYPAVLQHVEIPIVGNDVCAVLMKPRSVTVNMLCAGNLSNQGISVNDEGDCRGDSGGPLLQIDGGVHTVVGLVSWGKDSCTLVDEPGVYQRVSSYVGWIKRNACNMGSSADFCDDTFLPTGFPTPSPPPISPPISPPTSPPISPTDSPSLPPISPTDSPTPYPTGFAIQDDCGAGNLGLRFRATVVTDDFAYENTISAYSFNQDYTDLDKLIFRKGVEDDLEDNTKYYFPSDDEYYCLEDDRCYYFLVTDYYGDGIAPKDNNHVYEGFLGKKRKFKGGKDEDWLVSPRIFCTGKICEDRKKRFRIGKKKHTCREYVRGGRERLKRKCNTIARDGMPVHKLCPETCGRRAGVGDCHWWKFMEKALRKVAKESIANDTPSPTPAD